MNGNVLFEMRIENRPVGQTSDGVSRGTETKQSGKFSDALAAQTAKPRTDTLEISCPAAVDTAQSEAVKAAGPAPEILPTDSVQVKLEKLRQIAEQADYTGMSYKEISDAIWKRYNDAFDGNMAAITTFPSPPDWGRINNQFVEEWVQAVEYPIQREIRKDTGLEPGDKGYMEYRCSRYGSAHFMTQYDGLSVEEKEQAILEKYAGKDTLLDFLNMQDELHRAGVLGHKMGGKAMSQYFWAIQDQLKHSYFFDNFLTGAPIRQKQWDAALYGKFDVHSFAAGLKEHMQHLTFSGFDFDVAGAVSKGIDDLIAALEKRDAEQIS